MSNMWTPPRTPRLRNFSSDNEEDQTLKRNTNDVKPDTDRRDEYMLEVLGRLVDAISRSSAVMSSAVETMEALAPPINKSLPDDDSVLINAKRNDKVTVEVKCTFLKINDIDTVNQQFEAEIFVQAKWEEPLLQQSLYASGDQVISTSPDKDIDVDKLVPWDPKLIVMNIDGSFTLDRKTYDVHFQEAGCKYPLVMQLWRFKGFFKENLELEHFPVDVQDLTISISTERSDKEIELIEDQTALSSINTKAFMDSQEWNLYKHIETYRDYTTVEYCSSTVHPIVHFQCRVGRKTGYFVWNIVFIMLLIISLTFAAFTIDNGTADRITVTITLFLTAVAFKLVVKQSLPTISYLTYLDLYVLAALIFLGMQAAQNACMNAFVHFLEEDEVKFFDRWSMVALATLLVVFHIFFAVYIYKTASKRRRIMEEKDKLYESKREFLDKYGSLPPRYDNGLDITTEYDTFMPGRKLVQYKTR